MSTPQVEPRPAPGLPRLAPAILLDIALPWLAVQLLLRQEVAIIPALIVAALFPIGSLLAHWRRGRRVDPIGIVVLVTLITGIAVAVLTDDPRFALLKAAPAFGLFGLACLLSIRRSRPLMFFVARATLAGGDPARAAAWDARLGNPGFRAAMRRITAVWGVATLVEAALGIAAAFLLPLGTALVAEPALGIATVALLLTWTRAYARARRNAAAGPSAGA